MKTGNARDGIIVLNCYRFGTPVNISNGYYTLVFNATNGQLSKISTPTSTIAISQEYREYNSFFNETLGQCSGSYIFRTENPAASPDKINNGYVARRPLLLLT